METVFCFLRILKELFPEKRSLRQSLRRSLRFYLTTHIDKRMFYINKGSLWEGAGCEAD